MTYSDILDRFYLNCYMYYKRRVSDVDTAREKKDKVSYLKHARRPPG